MTFTEQFEAKQIDEKNQYATDERNQRAKENLDSYVALPVAVPIMGKLSPAPINFRLGWAIAVPGKVFDDENNPQRGVLTLGFPDEETAEDFCYALNNAKHLRKLNSSGEYKR